MSRVVKRDASGDPALDIATRRIGADPYRPCGPCRSPWHDWQAGTLGGTGTACADCGAVMMPGGPVRPAFAAEYERRLAESVCLSSRGGIFLCRAKVKPEIRSTGACLCGRHNR